MKKGKIEYPGGPVVYIPVCSVTPLLPAFTNGTLCSFTLNSCAVGKGKYSVLKMWEELLDIGSRVMITSGDPEDYQCDLVVRLGACGEAGDRVLT